MRRGHTHKKERGVQVFKIFRKQIGIVLVGNFLVGGPKFHHRVGDDRWWFQAYDRLLKPVGERR